MSPLRIGGELIGGLRIGGKVVQGVRIGGETTVFGAAPPPTTTIYNRWTRMASEDITAPGAASGGVGFCCYATDTHVFMHGQIQPSLTAFSRTTRTADSDENWTYTGGGTTPHNDARGLWVAPNGDIYVFHNSGKITRIPAGTTTAELWFDFRSYNFENVNGFWCDGSHFWILEHRTKPDPSLRAFTFPGKARAAARDIDAIDNGWDMGGNGNLVWVGARGLGGKCYNVTTGAAVTASDLDFATFGITVYGDRLFAVNTGVINVWAGSVA